MRARSIAALVGGLPLVLSGMLMRDCKQQPAPPSKALQLAMARPMRVVVGESVPLGYVGGRLGRGGRIVPASSRTPRTTTVLRARDTTVATVTADGILRGLTSGRTTVIAQPPGSSTTLDTMVIQVVTRRQSVNIMAVELCPNRDGPRVERDQPVSDSVADIHEFHDCQRLVMNDTYGPLTGIFAHLNVKTARTWEAFRDGRIAAVIVNFVADRPPTSYPSLRIAPGTNCLYLKADTVDVWHAAVLQQEASVVTADTGRSYGRCDETLTWADIPDSAKNKLEVRLQKAFDLMGRPHAPPVARWDWDRASRRNYMGVKCDSLTWCEIGPPEFRPSAPLRMAVGDPPQKDTLEIFKGYYDEQFLADSLVQKPSTVWGTITPGVDARDTSVMKHDNEERWYHMADVAFAERGSGLSDDFRRYTRTYKGQNPTDAERVQRLSTSKYELYPKHGGAVPFDFYSGQLNAKRLKEPSVVYRKHGHLKGVPPVVRWRWMDSDELTWSWCDPEGCCEKVRLLEGP